MYVGDAEVYCGSEFRLLTYFDRVVDSVDVPVYGELLSGTIGSGSYMSSSTQLSPIGTPYFLFSRDDNISLNYGIHRDISTTNEVFFRNPSRYNGFSFRLVAGDVNLGLYYYGGDKELYLIDDKHTSSVYSFSVYNGAVLRRGYVQSHDVVSFPFGSDGTWLHAAFIVVDGSVRLYMNGVLYAEVGVDVPREYRVNLQLPSWGLDGPYMHVTQLAVREGDYSEGGTFPVPTSPYFTR